MDKFVELYRGRTCWLCEKGMDMKTGTVLGMEEWIPVPIPKNPQNLPC